MADTGNGATVGWATYSETLLVIDIELGEQSIEALDTSVLSSSGFKTYIPTDLAEPNEVTLTVQWATTDDPPVPATADTLTVTFPQRTGETAAANLAGTGFFKSVSFPTLENSAVQEAEIVFQFDGETGPTWTKATTA